MALTREFLAQLDDEDEEALNEADLARLDAINFCTLWPELSRALVFIRDNVLGGGVGSRVVKWAIGQIIKIGDRKCPG